MTIKENNTWLSSSSSICIPGKSKELLYWSWTLQDTKILCQLLKDIGYGKLLIRIDPSQGLTVFLLISSEDIYLTLTFPFCCLVDFSVLSNIDFICLDPHQLFDKLKCLLLCNNNDVDDNVVTFQCIQSINDGNVQFVVYHGTTQYYKHIKHMGYSIGLLTWNEHPRNIDYSKPSTIHVSSQQFCHIVSGLNYNTEWGFSLQNNSLIIESDLIRHTIPRNDDKSDDTSIDKQKTICVLNNGIWMQDILAATQWSARTMVQLEKDRPLLLSLELPPLPDKWSTLLQNKTNLIYPLIQIIVSYLTGIRVSGWARIYIMVKYYIISD